MIVLNAQVLTNSRWCAAANCPNDAQFSQPLCESCAQKLRAGKTVRLQEPPPPPPDRDATLVCSTCLRWLPDDSFPIRRAPSAAYRRHRNCECRECAAKRRRDERANETPEQSVLRRAIDNQRRRAYRLRRKATP